MKTEFFAVNHPWNDNTPGEPDIFKRPGMESSRFDLLEFRHNGFENRLQEFEDERRETAEEQVCHNLRLAGIEEELRVVQTWLGLGYKPNQEGRLILDGSLQDVIADSGIMAINHCQESAAAMVTVAVSATDTRADAMCKQMDLVQSLLLNVWELVRNLNDRLEALESHNPA